jgi:uncharacterized Zn-finger protein
MIETLVQTPAAFNLSSMQLMGYWTPSEDRSYPSSSAIMQQWPKHVGQPLNTTPMNFQAQNTNYHRTSAGSSRVQYQRMVSHQSSSQPIQQHYSSLSSIPQPKAFPASSNLISPLTTYNYSNLGQQNDRPFKCDQCPQSFNRNHDLKRHKRIHLAVKPFPCGHCEKSFSRKDALKVRSLFDLIRRLDTDRTNRDISS